MHKNINVYFVGGWGNSSSSKSRAAQSAKLFLLLQILSISLINLEVSSLLKKVKDPVLKFVRILVKAFCYSSPLWLTALTVVLSLHTVSEGHLELNPSHFKSTLINEGHDYTGPAKGSGKGGGYNSHINH